MKLSKLESIIVKLLIKTLFSSKYQNMIRNIIKEEISSLPGVSSLPNSQIMHAKIDTPLTTILNSKNNKHSNHIDEKFKHLNPTLRSVLQDTLIDNPNNPILKYKDNVDTEDSSLLQENNENNYIDLNSMTLGVNEEGIPEVNVDAFMNKFMKNKI